MSVSPASNCDRILSVPSTSCFAPRPRGTSPVSLYGLLTNPIGCEVNMLSPSPMLFQRASSQEIRQTCALELWHERVYVVFARATQRRCRLLLFNLTQHLQ